MVDSFYDFDPTGSPSSPSTGRQSLFMLVLEHRIPDHYRTRPDIEDIIDVEIVSTTDEGYQRFLVR